MAQARNSATGKPVDLVALQPIRHDGKRYAVGDVLTVPESQADALRTSRAAEAVPVKSDGKAKAKAEAEARARAEADAKALAEAQAAERAAAEAAAAKDKAELEAAGQGNLLPQA